MGEYLPEMGEPVGKGLEVRKFSSSSCKSQLVKFENSADQVKNGQDEPTHQALKTSILFLN
jgi:hypothetical protein